MKNIICSTQDDDLFGCLKKTVVIKKDIVAPIEVDWEADIDSTSNLSHGCHAEENLSPESRRRAKKQKK